MQSHVQQKIAIITRSFRWIMFYTQKYIQCMYESTLRSTSTRILFTTGGREWHFLNAFPLEHSLNLSRVSIIAHTIGKTLTITPPIKVDPDSVIEYVWVTLLGHSH